MPSVAVRFALVLCLLSALFASGCAGSAVTITVEQTQEASKLQGPASASGTCKTDGQLAVSYSMGEGSLRITVKDAQGGTPYDSGTLPKATAQSFGQTIHGAPGTWTVTAERSAFTGSYAIQVVC